MSEDENRSEEDKKADEDNQSRIKQPVVYLPPGAKINVGNFSDAPPPTRYDRRRVTFDINGVKRMVGGIYGKRDD